MSDWKQAGENLVRHANGVYYLRAKVLGKVIRVSLKTSNLRIAKIKRDERLKQERSKAKARKPGGMVTLRDALEVLRVEMVNRPHLRPKTISYAKGTVKILENTLPLAVHGKKWGKQDAAAWWSKVVNRYSPSVANKVLAAGRRLAALLIEHGLRTDDQTADLRRVPIRQKHRPMPGRTDMDRIVEFIRCQRKRGSLESSRMVAVLAFSGMRVGECRTLHREELGGDWLVIGSDGETKGRTFRRVPIAPPLRAVLDVMLAERDDGPLFAMASPRRALHSACAALGLPDMRVHDLRHFFATWCIESGVDIPTVAKWLGHKDGGALAMKTYGHVRDDHGAQAAAGLR